MPNNTIKLLEREKTQNWGNKKYLMNNQRKPEYY